MPVHTALGSVVDVCAYHALDNEEVPWAETAERPHFNSHTGVVFIRHFLLRHLVSVLLRSTTGPVPVCSLIPLE